MPAAVFTDLALHAGARLDSPHLAELTVSPKTCLVKLRTAPNGTGPGFDIVFSDDASSVQLVRVLEVEDSLESPFDVSEDDAERLRSLRSTLVLLTMDLAPHKQPITGRRCTLIRQQPLALSSVLARPLSSIRC